MHKMLTGSSGEGTWGCTLRGWEHHIDAGKPDRNSNSPRAVLLAKAIYNAMHN